jgi:hypothetical protein
MILNSFESEESKKQISFSEERREGIEIEREISE